MSDAMFGFWVPWFAGVAATVAVVAVLRWLNRPRPRRDEEEE